MTQIRQAEIQSVSILGPGKRGSAQREYDNAADPSRTRIGGATNRHELIAGLCCTNGRAHTNHHHRAAEREEQRSGSFPWQQTFGTSFSEIRLSKLADLLNELIAC